MTESFNTLAKEIIAGRNLTFEEALSLIEIDDDETPALATAAALVRRHFSGDRADLCSIISARSGRCSEDCRFCSQSSRYDCQIDVHPMTPANEILAAAKRAESGPAHRFCIVTSGDLLSDSDFDTVLEAVALIRKETSLKRCASLGRLSPDRAAALAEAGLNRYHHNLETARDFFPSICTTHSYDDRVDTIRFLKEMGLEMCVGGIINLGESLRQRIEFAFELKELEPDSVPINFLNPRKGTPLEARPPLEALEAIKYLAVLRLILVRPIIRLAAGRCETLGGFQRMGMEAGVNGLLIGDYLTTAGPAVARDINMLAGLGFDIGESDV